MTHVMYPKSHLLLPEVGQWIILDICAGDGVILGQFRAAPSKLLESFCFYNLLHVIEDGRQPQAASQNTDGSQQGLLSNRKYQAYFEQNYQRI